MIETLASLPLFQEMDRAKLEVLARRVVARTYPKHTVLITEGDHSDTLYIILAGRVKAFLSDENGREVILNFQEPGEYFGEMALLDEQPRSASVVTLEACRFGLLAKSDFMAFLAEHPETALVVIRHLSARLRVLTEKVRELALLDVYGRISKTLQNLAEPQDGKLVVSELLTHQDLANLVGASREMVTKILKDLVLGGYIRVEQKRITLLKKPPRAW